MSEAKISEAVGIVGSMHGTEGFTMACFKADEVPVGTPLYLHPQSAELAERQELDFYREHIGNDLDNLLIGAGVLQVTHEGGYEACWQNTMDAVERLAATGKQQIGEVQGDALATLSASWRTCAEKHDENAREADSIGDMTATVQYLETKSEVLRQVAAELEAALAARNPGVQERVAWASTGATGHKVVAMPGLHKLPYGDYDLYAAPPAQGIDLGQFRPFVQAERAHLSGRIERCDAIGSADRLEALQAKARECDRLLTLIDGQRDAASGVE